MADLFFLIAGIVFLVKKEIKITKNKTLTGRRVKILAILYFFPFVFGFLGGILASKKIISTETAFWAATPFIIIDILTTIYFIFFIQNKKVEKIIS